MKKLRSWFVATLGVAAVAATAIPMLPVWQQLAQPTAPASPSSQASTSRILVDLKDDASSADIAALETRLGIDLQANSIVADENKLQFANVSAADRARVLQALGSDENVEAAEAEITYTLPEPMRSDSTVAAKVGDGPEPKRGAFVPNDPRYIEQWNLRMVGAEMAWKRSRGKDIVVAVIDTGVAARDSKNGKRAKDFNKTSFVRGYNFVDDNRDPYDDIGHGTHVAGTIAESTNNKEGVAGLAFEATIMPLKVFSASGGGTSGDIADAIRYAADHGANVINLSLGGPQPSRAIRVAVKHAHKKGVVIVCAAGNGFGEPVNYPAAFPECIAVSAVGPSGERAFYSSYGKQVALAAPGGDMRNGPHDGILQNTIIAEEFGGQGDGYYHFQGTSMATPHVSATAALLMAQGVTDGGQIRDILVQSASPKGPKLEYGAGLLSADAATALVVRRNWLDFIKDIVVLIVSLLFFRTSAATPMSLAGVAFNMPGHRLRVRFALALAVWLGAFIPALLTRFIGADSIWNLAGFSALLPFMLFWEWEKGIGSKVVAAFAAGVALCLLWALVTVTLPFTYALFGYKAWWWSLANIAASMLISYLAWQRGR